MVSNSEEAVGRIAALARSGRLDAAAIQVVDALARNPGDPILSALGGAVEFHRGQFKRAIPYLEVALRHKPNDLTIRINLAESQFHEGNQAEALALCDEAIALADPSLRLARLGAHLAQALEEFPLAVRLYRHLVKQDAKDWSLWNNLGNALASAGDHDGAVEALKKAVALAPDSQPIRINLGDTLIDAGRADEGEAVLVQAGKDFADDPKPYLSLFNLYRLSGREDDAYAAIVEAARRAPEDAAIQSDRGQEAARRNRYDEAEAAFEAAARLDPQLGPPYVGLASVYERMNREVELEPLKIRAEAAGTDARSISFIDALRLKRAEAFDDAFAALEAAGDVIVPGRKHHLRGIMLDRLGQHDEAFEAFTAMNVHWQADPTNPAERARQYREMVASATEVLTPEWLESWSPAMPFGDRPSPIFIVGFPRSGTTLLDTMLMADPRVRVLEEEPFLVQAELELGGIEGLAAATEDQIRLAREGYFERAASISKLEPDSIIVDKHPMHLNKVPVALRLFPDARFVLAMRHPCDVLLSCYITNFRLNPAMANFLDLDDAATLYDLTFSHWEKARGLFDMPVATIVYERLIEDTQGQLEPVFEWLGMQWPGKAFDHTKAARARGTVATASYAQVTEPIYSRAKGRWTKYRRHLERIHPVLAPWIERYGYDF